MENRAHALIAGSFTLLLGLATVFALWWFGGKNEATSDYLVLTTKNVTGLNPQAQVRYRGVRVGRVQSIDLDAADVTKTVIRIRIRADIPITRGTFAKLGYQGVTGIAHISLEDQGKDPSRLAGEGAQPGQIPMQESLLQEVADVGAETLRQVRDLVAGMNQLLSTDNRQRLSRTLAHLEEAGGNAREVSHQLKRLLSPEAVQRVNSILLHADQSLAQTDAALRDARGLISRLQSVSEKLDVALGEPQTGAGVLPRISELTGDLTATARQLNRVLLMLEDAPQSLVFGRDRAPGPGEPGFDNKRQTGEQP